MSGRVSEDGLSEVIGFILILGLLVVVLSLYVTYVVPSEGRTHEIEQMDYIKQQFLDYKLSTDALWLNNQIGASISQSIRMGTGEATTSGMFGGFSLVSPVGSSGSVMVNPMERSERMHITATGVTQNNPAVFRVIDAPIIDSISPKSVDVGESDIVEIRGSGFGDLDKVEVYFNGRKIESGVTVNNNLITINVLSSFTTQAGIIHIYVKKPTGVRSNYGYLLIKKSGDNPVPENIVIPDYYVVDSGGSISITATNANENSIVFVDNIPISYGTSINPNDELFKEIFDHPNVVPVTVINPQPGGGSASKKLYVLPDSSKVIFPEIWGISPNQVSTESSLSEPLKIYGAGFSGSTVWWEDEQIDSGSVSISSDGNLISISPTWFTGKFDTTEVVTISVRSGKSSDSTQILKGFLISNPPGNSPHSNIPVKHFYLTFINKDINPHQTYSPMTFDALQNQKYGVELHDENNDLTIQIIATPRIVSSDWPDPTVIPTSIDDDPSSYEFLFSYQTDLILNVQQGDTKITENYVIKSNIQQGSSTSFDLLNPAYGIIDFLKVPFSFTPAKIGPLSYTETNFDIEYTLLSDSFDDTIIIDNALGGLEYNSKNYYYRSQQDFIYQNGGVFVEQPDGSYPLVLPPISISRDGDNLVVGITNIPVSGYDTVGGSSQVQVSSTLDSVNTFGLTPGLPNAKSVLLHIDPTTESNWVKWITTLKAICENARSNGVPVAFSRDDDNYDSAWVRIEDDVSGVPMLNIRGGGDENDQDIILDLKTSEFSVSLNPVGKAVSIR